MCVGIPCMRLTRHRLHTQSVWWPVLQPASSGLDCNTKSFHITAISALPMAVRSRSLNPHSHDRNVQWNKLSFKQVCKFRQSTHIKISVWYLQIEASSIADTMTCCSTIPLKCILNVDHHESFPLQVLTSEILQYSSIHHVADVHNEYSVLLNNRCESAEASFF